MRHGPPFLQAKPAAAPTMPRPGPVFRYKSFKRCHARMESENGGRRSEQDFCTEPAVGEMDYNSKLRQSIKALTFEHNGFFLLPFQYLRTAEHLPPFLSHSCPCSRFRFPNQSLQVTRTLPRKAIRAVLSQSSSSLVGACCLSLASRPPTKIRNRV